jgi:hypothetical protein
MPIESSTVDPAMTLATKHKGAFAELIAAAWLLAQGFDVFRNVSQHGLVDIVAIQSGVVYYFDVKSAFQNGQGARLSVQQIELGVKPIYVLRDGTCRIDFDPEPAQKTRVQCAHCTRWFMPHSMYRRDSGQIFCSAICRKAHERPKAPPRDCPECGNVILPSRGTAKFCSISCTDKAARKAVEKRASERIRGMARNRP